MLASLFVNTRVLSVKVAAHNGGFSFFAGGDEEEKGGRPRVQAKLRRLQRVLLDAGMS